MAWKRIVLGKPQANITDGYRSVASLLGFGGESGYKFPNGSLVITANGATVRVQRGQPADADPGDALPAGTALDQQADPSYAWDLAEVWIRNSVGGAVCILVVNGPILKET